MITAAPPIRPATPVGYGYVPRRVLALIIVERNEVDNRGPRVVPVRAIEANLLDLVDHVEQHHLVHLHTHAGRQD